MGGDRGVAPVLGVLLGLLISVPDEVLGSMLASSPASSCTSAPPSCCRRRTGRIDRAGSALWTFAGVVAIYLFSIWAGVVGVAV